MEKLSHTTESIIDENVEKLAELFPEVVTEVREPDGSLRHTIDVDALKERVGDVAEGQRERYQFTWPGKRKAKQEAYRQIDKCLRSCPEESVDWDTTQNLYIEGDNLDALKLLRNTYAGKVKMIYIDPPYNTGHDFIYDDDFAQTKADYDAESGDYDEEGGRLVANPESNGRFHSDWCCMMYPRLLLARDLLSEDGAIFVSIDDNEQETIKKMLDEVFGQNNRVGDFIVIRAEGGGLAKQVIKGHDYLFVYARAIDTFTPLGRPKDIRGTIVERDGKKYWIQEDWLRKEFGKYGNCHYEEVLKYKGQDAFDEINVGLQTGKYVLVPKSNGMHVVGKLRDISQDASKFYSVLKHLSSNGTKDLKALDLDAFFSYPKPVSLLSELVSGITFFDGGQERVILDFFSGSATTAHAVMQLNAEDGGNRKFIMVQLPEVCDEKSEAAKAGYKNICEIGKERIRRAGRKIAEGMEESNRQLKLGEEPRKVPDIGFRVLKIDSSNFEDVSAEPGELSQGSMLRYADNLKLDRTPDDLIIQVMLKKQIELSAPIEKLDVDGCTVFSVDGGRLVACFDRDVPVEIMTAMAKMEPDYAVMRDASFAGDDAVSNFSEIFKNYSPVTEVEVI